MTDSFSKRIKLTTVLAVVLWAAGCRTDNQAGYEFFPDQGERSVQQFARVQAENAAREDASLREDHFDGGKLNSLGEAQLALMLPPASDDDVRTVTLWLDIAEGDG